MSLNNRKLPVFAFPNCFKFYVGTKSTHKQIMTLYNLYDFTVRFKVLSTAPLKYAVTEAEGTIGSHMSVDIIIKHTSPFITNCNVTDKFRISMQDNATKECIGSRLIEAMLLPGEVENISNDGDFENLPSSDKESTHFSFSERGSSNAFLPNRGTTNVTAADRGRTIEEPNRQIAMVNSTNYIISIIIGLICVLALLLPTKEEIAQPSSSVVPEQFHITLTLKLILSYVLGLLTIVIMRP